VETGKAGLLLLVPDLIALDLPALVRAAGYTGTRVVPALSWLLSLLALKLTRTRRVSHVDDLLLSDPAVGLFAGLGILPKKSALTDYSYRTSHTHQRAFLAALDAKMITAGLATRADAIFDLDFHRRHALGPRPRTGEALRAHPLPTRPLRAHLLRPRLRHPQPPLRQRRGLQSHPGPRGHRVLRPLEGRLRRRPPHADHGPESHHPARPGRTRRAGREVPHPADAFTHPGHPDQRPGPRRLQDPNTVRRLIVTGLGREAGQSTDRARGADALSSTVNLNVDLDITLCVLSQALLAAFRARLPGYTAVTPDVLQRRFLETPGTITITTDTITVRLDRRAYAPVLRTAALPNDTIVPWWGNRTLRYEIS
jgi:hypothetical protein